MNKAYERINWENYPSENTALNEANLNKMDAALNEVDNRVVAHETTKLDKATANSMVKDVSFDETTGIFTITFLNGVTKTLDTKLEKIAVNFEYDKANQKLVLTLIDGTVQEIDISALITEYEFENSAYINWTVVDGKAKAEIIDGSITADKLQPNFLADVTLQANSAKISEQNAKTSEENAKQSEINAKNYADSAEPVASTANGLNPTLDKSAGAPIISMLGNGATEQQTYSGKNKLGLASSTLSKSSNTTFADGTITMDMSADIDTYAVFATATKEVLANTAYTLSFMCSGIGASDTIRFEYLVGKTSIGKTTLKNGKNEVPFILSEAVTDGKFALDDMVRESTSTIKLYDFQIEEGTATDYEPYVGGTASPNPDYSQDIHGVGESGVLSVKTVGKQLFDEVNYNKFIYSTTIGADLTTQATTRYGTTDLIDGSKDLTCSLATGNDVLGLFWGIKDGVIAKHEIFRSTTCYSGGTYDYSVIGFGKVSHSELTTDDLINAECMVEIGTEKTPYESCTATQADIPLNAPMYDGDYIRYNMDGSGEESHDFKGVILNGSESGWKASSKTGVYYITLADAKYAELDANTGNVQGLCTHFTMLKSYSEALSKGYGYCGFGVSVALKQTIIGFNTGFTTVDEWKAWLAENPITVVYELAEPTVTPLTAEQIAEFEKLRTFDGTTHVTCEANCELQYFYDSVSGKAVAMIANMIKK